MSQLSKIMTLKGDLLFYISIFIITVRVSYFSAEVAMIQNEMYNLQYCAEKLYHNAKDTRTRVVEN